MKLMGFADTLQVNFNEINCHFSYGACDFELWKQLWLNRRCIALIMWRNSFSAIHLQKLVLVNILNAYLDLLEHIYMTVFYRFISDLEAIKVKRGALEINFEFSQSTFKGTSFSSKVKIRGMSYRLLEYIP